MILTVIFYIFVACTAIQIVYYLIFSSVLFSNKNKELHKTNNHIWFENKKADKLIIALYGAITYQKCWDRDGNEVQCLSNMWLDIVKNQTSFLPKKDCKKKLQFD